jgi:hypothetical protein
MLNQRLIAALLVLTLIPTSYNFCIIWFFCNPEKAFIKAPAIAAMQAFQINS